MQQQQQKQHQEDQRVLSIQSHVVSGYVGNKAAVFPLQLLGFDVDVINSVHFSNHTGHPHGFEGQIMNGDQLKTILNGLQRNDLLYNVSHLLTGYIGSETFLRSVLHVLQTLKDEQQKKEQRQQQQQQREEEENKSVGGSNVNSDSNDNGATNGTNKKGNKYSDNVVRYVCDPVLGDHGKLYVPEELVSVYREEVVPLADVVTPNQFEVELLTGISIRSMEDGIRACKALHNLGPDLVIITSMSLDTSTSTNSCCNPDANSKNAEEQENSNGEILTMLASERIRDEITGEIKHHNMWSIETPQVQGKYTGTGDVCAALFLAWTAKIDDLKEILEKVASTMYALIKFTSESSSSSDGSNSIASRELKLIQSKGIIESPIIMFRAKRIEDQSRA